MLWRLQKPDAKVPSWAVSLCLSALLGSSSLLPIAVPFLVRGLADVTDVHVSDFSHPCDKIPARNTLKEE